MTSKNMTRPFRLLTQPLRLALLMLAVCGVSLVQADLGNSSTDEIFGGQILSLTEEKPPLKPSNDPRFQDNKDGTITTICYICRLFFSLKEVENDDNASESISRFRLLFVLL
jgi:hypothetical protein